MIKIKWLGHACYKIFFDDIQCVIDPFADGYVPGYKNIDTSADMVFASHSHADHSAVDKIKCTLRMVYGLNVRKVNVYHDDKNGALRGENTVHIFEYKGIKLAHFGDIGHTLTSDQINEIGDIDIAIIPVGGTYTVNAENAKIIAQQVNAKLIIPTHYRSGNLGFDVLDTVDKFTNLFENVQFCDSDEIVIQNEIPNKVVVLKYMEE